MVGGLNEEDFSSQSWKTIVTMSFPMWRLRSTWYGKHNHTITRESRAQLQKEKAIQRVSALAFTLVVKRKKYYKSIIE